MAAEILQASFSKGELSPRVRYRPDIQPWHTGLRRAKNTITMIEGGQMNRPGLQHVAQVRDGAAQSRLMPFEFNTTSKQNYILELGTSLFRVIMNGGLVLTGSSATITGITQADPGVVSSTSHGLANGTIVYLAGITGMTQLNGRFAKVANANTNDFELQDLDGNDLDTTGFSAYVSGGTATANYTAAHPWAVADLRMLKFTQDKDTLFIAHPSYEPRKITRSGHANWTVSSITFAPTIGTPTLSALSGAGASGGSTTWSYKVTAVDSVTQEESDASAVATTAVGKASLTATDKITVTVTTAVTGAGSYNIYKFKNGLYGFIGNTETTTFDDTGIDPDTSDAPPTTRNPFSGSDNRPGCVEFHEQRLSWARSNNNPNRWWASQSAQYTNMNVSSPTNDADAITLSIAARKAQEVRHIVSVADLLLLTVSGVWRVVPADDTGRLTPVNVKPVNQSDKCGASDVPPLVVGSEVLYITDFTSSVRALDYKLENNKYNPTDISVLSRHLLKGRQILAWDFAAIPNNTALAVCDDGVVLCITYLKDQEVLGWTWWNTDGKFKDVAVIQEDGEDVAYFIVERTINGTTKQFIEKLHSREFHHVEDAFFLDCAITYDGWNATAATVTLTSAGDWQAESTITVTASTSTFTSGDVGKYFSARMETEDDEGRPMWATAKMEITAYTSGAVVEARALVPVPELVRNVATTKWGRGVTTITGLEHLEGETITALADGGVFRDLVVTNASVTFAQPVMKAHMGKGYTSDIQTMPLDTAGQGATYMHAMKKTSKATAYVNDTRGLWFGPNFNTMYEAKAEVPANPNEAMPLITGAVESNITAVWNQSGQVCMQQRDPLPVEFLGVSVEATLGR